MCLIADRLSLEHRLPRDYEPANYRRVTRNNFRKSSSRFMNMVICDREFCRETPIKKKVVTTIFFI
ncbi:hypothetical protein CUM87_11450 [Enterococcus faecium]|nr:hypothetical protein [Enterococcus faecium]PQC15365.1 hypothetical protein CUM87_11450 [Enterococcus faecium]